MIRFRPAAARELGETIAYYGKQYPGRDDRFLAELEDALARVSETPLGFPIIHPPDVRSAKVERFPYRVVFLVVGEDVDVLALAHARRRPAYWRKRG